MNDHLTDPEIERFILGELTASEVKRVVRHLLQGCEACEERLQPFLDLVLQPERIAVPTAPPPTDEDYDDAIARAMGSVVGRLPEIRRERERIERGCALLRAPAGLAGLSDEEAESLRGGPLVEALLELSFEERYRDPGEMLQLALLARTAAEGLDAEVYGHGLVADLQARAWAELGNAYRVADDLDEAGAALDEAERRLRQGTGDLYLLARVADLRASLCCDRREARAGL